MNDLGLGAGNGAKFPVQHAKKSAKKQTPPQKRAKRTQKKVQTN